jgi:hypothetical protein
LDVAAVTLRETVSQAYRTRYVQYAGSYLEPLISPAAEASTVRLVAE